MATATSSLADYWRYTFARNDHTGDFSDGEVTTSNTEDSIPDSSPDSSSDSSSDSSPETTRITGSSVATSPSVSYSPSVSDSSLLRWGREGVTLARKFKDVGEANKYFLSLI